MNIAVFGGTGFVGTYIIKLLNQYGFKPKVLVRKESKLKLEINCDVVIGDVENNIEEVISGTDAIIYNIGIIREFSAKGITYNKLHYEGAKKCIVAAQKLGIKRFILMSANGVKENGTDYQTTKWMAEQELIHSKLDWTIFRPSLIFGDPLGNGRPEFCTQLKKDMLGLPLPAPLFYKGIIPINAGDFSMSPIHVKNVAEFFVKSLTLDGSIGKIYNLGGKNEFTWKEIIHNIALASNKSTWKIPAPIFFIKILANLFDRFSWFPVTRDQLSMLVEGNIVNESYFDEFDIKPIDFSLETLKYLHE